MKNEWESDVRMFFTAAAALIVKNVDPALGSAIQKCIQNLRERVLKDAEKFPIRYSDFGASQSSARQEFLTHLAYTLTTEIKIHTLQYLRKETSTAIDNVRALEPNSILGLIEKK